MLCWCSCRLLLLLLALLLSLLLLWVAGGLGAGEQVVDESVAMLLHSQLP
jgi:hypothetical protein